MYLLTTFKKENKKSNKIEGLKEIAIGGFVGQQVIRSGLPRVLGVRLESHSTSKKNAKQILKNKGRLDPNKSGSGAIRSLENNQGLDTITDINKAKGKVYITGLHKNAVDRIMKDQYGDNVVLKANEGNPISNVIARKNQRVGYRVSAGVDWDKVNKEGQAAYDRVINNKLNQQVLGSEGTKDRAKTIRLLAGAKERARQSIKNSLIPTGRSLYIGGSDNYFDKNFKPDFDDPKAMYSTKKIKVHGNRLAATDYTLKRYGKGNRLKGALTLIKANPKRALAGAAILTIGGAISSKLVKSGINNIRTSKRDIRDDKGKKRNNYNRNK